MGRAVSAGAEPCRCDTSGAGHALGCDATCASPAGRAPQPKPTLRTVLMHCLEFGKCAKLFLYYELHVEEKPGIY